MLNRSSISFFQFLLGSECDPEFPYILLEKLERIRRVVDREGPFYSLLFCLRFEKDLTPKETAEILGESTNFVNVYTCKLRKIIRKEIGL